MVISFLQRRLKDIPISKKLYFTIGIMVLLITIELCTLGFAIGTLSSVRSYVGGEGLWSKAQKNAIFHLKLYAYSHDEKDYQAFHEYLKVPLGDKKARIELQKEDPDLAIVRQGFIEGRNHPDDIDGMTSLIRRFHNIYYIDKALNIWGEAEQEMETLIPVAEKLHSMVISNSASQQEIDHVLRDVEATNEKLTKLEDDFSFTLGEGSRWLENLLLSVLLILVITVETAGILITVSITKGLEKGLKEIIRGSDLIKKGILSTRVKVYSRDEIGVLATSFNQMTDTLENNMRERRDIEENLKKEIARAEASEKVEQLFLANMSHEIRTPMNAILGFARILEESNMDKEQLEYMHAIIKSGDELMVILNDILALSKIEEGKMVFENIPFNIKDIIDSTVLMSSKKAQLKNIDLTRHIDESIPDMLRGDSVHLNQILMNLVSNAIKFTEKGEIVIAVHCIEENHNNIVLEFIIKDTGIGIPVEKQSEIFEGFDQTLKKAGSTGLGLSIVKQLVERQNGKIFVNSKPGHGSDFHFILSFEKPTENEYPVQVKKKVFPEIQIGEQGRKEVSVLLVEDNIMNQMLAIKVLQKYGFDADVAENGIVALDKHNRNEYDIILMDLQMPEMDGYETTRNIRLMENGKKDIPIIAMTAHTIKGEIERCIDVGMTDYLSKPFHAEELYKKIRSLVNRVAL